MANFNDDSWSSRFGDRYSSGSGIGELMDDLGKAMASGDKIMLGGGNPASIDKVNQVWQKRLAEMIDDTEELKRALVFYDTPQGHARFLEEMALFLQREFRFPVTADNIAITNGSQSAMYYLLNLLGGTSQSGKKRKILFPLVPEYIGYADQHLEEDVFIACKPLIEEIGETRFKYHIDFSALEAIEEPLGAVCVSRPTNPTGNVLTDQEISQLMEFCRKRNLPLIIDNAYGAPFPHILFKDVTLVWDKSIILSMSLSKLGLPNTRTGILIADSSLIKKISSINAILSLSSGTLGQAITYPLLKDSTLLRLSREVVQPYYYQKSLLAQKWFDEALEGLPYRIHVSEGALFLWLWFRDLPVPTDVLYEKLKEKGVLVIPGKYFFYGLKDHWKHRQECIRITYSQNTVQAGIGIINDVLRSFY